ncbi:M28 family peptidase [Botrimarina sp.]|uniref:M28 family peptidase n=1 Tax=Botrimarina sp. TaxID=2795802 RepID=UPI0032EB7B67
MTDTPPDAPRLKPRALAVGATAALAVATALHLVMIPPGGSPTAHELAEGRTPAGEPLRRVANTPVENPLDADRAMGYLRDLCAIGPRISGTPGMQRQQQLVSEHFKELGAEVEFQPFTYPHPLTGKRVSLANLIVRWRPDAERRVLLCAHYDTRPLPDQDPDRAARQSGVFVGANDGASGVAVLMELGHLMAERFEEQASDEDFGVDFVLFDAEELVYRERDPYFLGSQYFASRYKNRRPDEWSYEAAVLLDMVGDADLRLPYEANSYLNRQSRPIAQEVWAVAERLGVDEFVPKLGPQVSDDHLALRRYGGIRAIDIIDFDYPHWHTRADTPDKCSGESLAKVGWVVWEWLLERAGEGE